MTDQANKLRNLMLSRKAEAVRPPENEPGQTPETAGRVITVASGKGGVGKSNFTLNLAMQFARRGKKVVIVDADFGLANIEVLFGSVARYDLADVINGKRNINEILMEGPLGVKVLSGGSGFSEISRIRNDQMGKLIEKFHFLDEISDIILIDTSAGLSNQVTDFVRASNEAVIVTTPEPTSITDAYAIIKTVHEQCGKDLPAMNIVVNRAENKKEGAEIFAKIERVCDKFLSLQVRNLGCLPYDANLIRAVKHQKPVSILYPNTPFVRSVDQVCLELLHQEPAQKRKNLSMSGFKDRLVHVFNNRAV